jgi:quercetin dioxygenase-like cupin family protein
MATSYMDYTSPNTQFAYDLSNNLFYKKDNQNYLNALTVQQLNTLGNNSLLDIYLSTGGAVEPHIHQNASELVYCISGAAVVSLVNPFTKVLLNFLIKPGQVANVPQGWWHYEIATVDNTHLLAIFDAPMIDTIFGSDIFRLTPANVLAHTYCLDEATVKQAFAPITKTVILGPPNDCNKVSPRADQTGAQEGVQHRIGSQQSAQQPSTAQQNQRQPVQAPYQAPFTQPQPFYNQGFGQYQPQYGYPQQTYQG